AGEVACVSVHGANRLGTNSLLDINVFGRRAGIYAAEYAKDADFVDLPENGEAFLENQIESLRPAERTEKVGALRAELQEVMDPICRYSVPNKQSVALSTRSTNCANATKTLQSKIRANATTSTCLKV